MVRRGPRISLALVNHYGAGGNVSEDILQMAAEFVRDDAALPSSDETIASNKSR
jgi:hypothetical protein